MTHRKPLTFDLLIPTYERPELLRRLLLSISSSPSLFDNILISDNSSRYTSHNQSVIECFPYLPITYFKQTNNLGEALNRKFLIDSALSEYAIIVADDDILYPSEIASLLLSLNDDHVDLDLIHFGYRLHVDGHSRSKVRRIPLPFNFYEHVNYIRDYVAFDFLPYAFFHPATYLFKVAFARKFTSSYPPTVGIGDDFCQLLDFAFHTSNIRISPLVCMGYYKDIYHLRETTNASSDSLSDSYARAGIYQYAVNKANSHPHHRLSSFILTQSFFRKITTSLGDASLLDKIAYGLYFYSKYASYLFAAIYQVAARKLCFVIDRSFNCFF